MSTVLIASYLGVFFIRLCYRVLQVLVQRDTRRGLLDERPGEGINHGLYSALANQLRRRAVWLENMSFLIHFLVFALLPLTHAILPDGRIHANIPPRANVPIVPIGDLVGPVVSRNGTELPPYNQTYFFDQLIDHTNPRLGTFQQRYWFTYEFYEPGGPIILFTPGEANAARKFSLSLLLFVVTVTKLLCSLYGISD